MKIAMFVDCYYPRVNGVVVSVKSYSEALVKKGHQVCIVCPEYKQNKNEKTPLFYTDNTVKHNPEVQILRIKSMDLGLWSKDDRLARLDQWYKIKTSMDEWKPDVIHVNCEWAMGWFGITYARHRHVPSVYTFHTLWEEYIACYSKMLPEFASEKVGRELVKFYLKRADEIIVPTERIGKVVDRYDIGKDYDILPTGIPENIAVYEKSYMNVFFNHLHNLLPYVHKKHVLLYVGRIEKEKNLDFLVDMLGEVRKTVNDAVLLFVGGGNYLEGLKAYAKKKPYSWNVCFAGYRTRDELSYFYNFADVFVFSSLTETQGLVTVEAMMCGLPVVAIGEMGTADIMRGDNGGFMVGNDLNEFSQCVCQLLTDSKLHDLKSKEAKEWSKQWSLTLLTDKLIGFYEKAIKRHGENKLQ